MKRNIGIATVVVLILIAFGLWHFFGQQTEEPSVASSSETEQAATEAAQPGEETASDSTAEEESSLEPAVASDTETSAEPPAESESASETGETLAPDTTESAAAPETTESLQTATLPSGDQQPIQPLVPPSFDVVRVEPNGDAVMAGRAPPGSDVTITDNGRIFGAVGSNAQGEWTFVSELPLAPGDHEISLWAQTRAGERIESDDIVMVSVPQPQIAAASSEPQTPVTVLVPKSGKGPSSVLQVPRGEGIAADDLVLEAIDYDVSGRVIVSGRASPGSRVIAYLDNRPLGNATVDADNRWHITSDQPLAPGLHDLRIDQIDDNGKVVARVQTPLSRSELLTQLADDQFFVVQPGNSLWRIARRAYGDGMRFTMIFEANEEQIRNPDLIYPGQIFVLPPSE